MRRWIWISLLALGIAILNFGIEVSDRLTSGQNSAILELLIYELTGVFTALILIPFLLWLFRRAPLTRDTWWRRLPIYFLVLIAFGLAHTTLMTVSRTLLFDLLGTGPYNPGVIPYRYLYEFHKQVVIFLFVYGIHRFFRHLEDSRARELAAAEVREQLTRARLESLRLRLNPHFLFNSLNLISSRMYEDADAADRLLASLSRLLRTSLSERQEVSLREEVESLEMYLSIMRERFGTRLLARIDFPPDTHDLQFPSFTLQPLVENSLKYGLEGTGNGQLELTVEARRSRQRLVVSVLDSGPGIKSEMPAGTGLGLATVRERLQALYGSEQSLELANRSNGGLMVTITIPARVVSEVKPTGKDVAAETTANTGRR